MSEAAPSGSSFLLAQEHSAQREHIKHIHAPHAHQHFHRSPSRDNHEERYLPELERKQARWEDAVTDVVTISIIKEINVDINGNTIAIKTIQTHMGDADDSTKTDAALWPPVTETLEASIPAEATPTYLSPPSIPSLPSESFLPSLPYESILPALPTESLLSSLPSLPVSVVPTTAVLPLLPSDLPASSTVAGASSFISSFDVASVQTFTPSISATDFPSLSADLNSTRLIPSSSSLSQTYTNSSTSTSASSYLSSSRSTSLFKSSTRSSITSTSLTDASTSTYLATTADGGGIAAGTGVAPASETGSSTTDPANDNSNSSASPTPTPVVIGGVVGSLAGAAVLIICLLYIIRWRKRGKGMLSLGSGKDGNQSRAQPEIQPSGGMTEQTPRGFAVPAALAALTSYSKRLSQKTEKTVSSTAPSEKGFYRVSGRKLPSVLQTGGDGYGGGIPHDSTMSGSSFYTDSQGFYGGGPSSPPIPISHRQSAGGIPFIRPSPARTPTQENSPFAFSESVTPPPPRRPDVLGRSHVSQDGSHASRFTEEV